MKDESSGGGDVSPSARPSLARLGARLVLPLLNCSMPGASNGHKTEWVTKRASHVGAAPNELGQGRVCHWRTGCEEIRQNRLPQGKRKGGHSTASVACALLNAPETLPWASDEPEVAGKDGWVSGQVFARCRTELRRQGRVS